MRFIDKVFYVAIIRNEIKLVSMQTLHEQHPIYGAQIVRDEQIQEFLHNETLGERKRYVILPETKAPNNRIFIILCFLDTENQLVLLQIKPIEYEKQEPVEDNGGDPVTTTNYEVMLCSADVTGLRPVIVKPERKFTQIGGPIDHKFTYPDGERGHIVKKLFLITKFEKKITNPEDLFWVPVSLLPKIFPTNNFFKDKRFSVLLQKINEKLGYETL